MCRTENRFYASLLGVILMLLAACTSSGATPSVPPTSDTGGSAPTAEAAPTEPAATVEAEPEPTAPAAPTEAATAVPEATESGEATPAPDVTAPADSGEATNPDYLDDRSNPRVLMASFVNALNTKQYLRAYSYWNAARAQDLAPFPEFEAGYAQTEAVKLNIGTVSGSAGAGTFKYTVPVTMESRMTEGENQIFVGCYLLHLSNPGAQGTPPFEPLGIEDAYVEQVEAGTDTEAAMETICEEGGFPAGTPFPAAPTPDSTDISNQVYIDDRSDPVAVLRSLFNAVNSAQYVRAYSYWEPDAEQLLSFGEFEAGYANTAAVELITGDVTSDPGAGQLYYSVPVTLNATNADGTSETFVGCYVLHLSQPAVQGTPPFQPLAIRSGSLEAVAADADSSALMAEACQM